MALIYACDSRSSADFKVCEVPTRNAADLLVFVDHSRSSAEGADGVWCYVDAAGASTSQARWVHTPNAADLLVCFVTSRSAAGWRREHPLKGRI